MTDLLLRFRGPTIALAVLAISASVAFAAAPPTRVSNPSQLTAKASESPEATENARSPEASEASKNAKVARSPEAADTHGALVSTAAQMETPVGFANHGAFVSCIARMDGTLAEVDWATVRPESCDAASGKAEKAADAAARAAEKAADAAARAAEAAAKGEAADAAAKGEAGKAKAAAARAAQGKPTR